jgi:putative membrane protein
MFNSDDVREPCLLSGVMAGCLGGFIATWIMNAAQTAAVQVADQLETQQAQTPQGARTVAVGEGRGAGPLENAQEATVATKRTATAVSRGLFGHELSDEERAVVAGVIPLAFGTLVGGIYGALTEYFPFVSVGHGTAYGTAVWLGAEELAMPGLKLSKPVRDMAWSAHATGLAGHLVYGFALDAARRMVRSFLR